MEDILVIAESNYSQVLFDQVKESFKENSDLECIFQLNDNFLIEPADWIGIYKVGFNNLSDFVCKTQIDSNTVKNLKGKVILKREDLPKDDGEFYQFVYVSNSKHIRGASVPFQFKQNDPNQTEDALLYKSTLTNDETLSDIRNKCLNLQNVNEIYEKLIKEQEELIKTLRDDLSKIKLNCLKFTMDNEKLSHILNQKEELIQKQNAECQKQKEKFDLMAKDNQLLNDQIELLKKEKNSDYDSFKKELNHLQSNLDSSEESSKNLREQQICLTNELNESKLKLNKTLDSNKNLEQENSALKKTLFDLNQKYEESNGLYYALKLAHSNLESRFKNTESQKVKLEQENLDLKESNRTANKEYSKLFEKYRLIRNKLFNQDINIYHDLNGDVHLRKNYTHFNMAETETDSAYGQEKTQTQTQTQTLARASSADIENTLLDALLGSSIYQRQEQQPQISTSTRIGIKQNDLNNNNLRTNENLSDDGLLNSRLNAYEQLLGPSAAAAAENDNVFTTNENTPDFARLQLTDNVSSNRFCDICNFVFTTEASLNEIEKHYATHYGPSCPICFLQFRKGYPQSDFENHVNTHFSS